MGKAEIHLPSRVMSFATAETTEAGWLQLRFVAGCLLKLEDAHELVQYINAVSGGRKLKVLVHLRPDVQATDSARRYFTGLTAAHYIETAAVILSPRFSRLSLWFSLRLSKPSFPVKLFSDRKKAFSWLSSDSL